MLSALKRYGFIAATVFLFLFSTSALVSAVQVTIDSGNFTGTWGIFTQPGLQRIDSGSGVKTVNLPSGNYSLHPWWASGIKFSVDAGGNVTVDNGISATGGTGTLTLKTSPVVFNPGNYIGQTVMALNIRFGGLSTVDLIPGVWFTFSPGTVNFPFNLYIDGNGQVTSTKPPGPVSGNTITYNTVEIELDPQNYQGNLWTSADASANQKGFRKIDVVRNAPYLVRYSYAGFGHSFFNVDNNGDITTNDPDSYTANGNRLTAKNVQINIDTGDFDNQVYIGPGPWTIGPHTRTLIPGARWEVQLDNEALWVARPTFDIDAYGNVTTEFTDSFTTSGNQITFNTAPISVVGNNYSGIYKIGGWTKPWTRGSDNVILTEHLVKRFAYNFLLVHTTDPVNPTFSQWNRFDVDGNGNIVLPAQNDDRFALNFADVIGNTFSLKTSRVKIKPLGHNENWLLMGEWAWHSGEQVLTLAENRRYGLQVGSVREWELFDVASPCEINNEEVVVDGKRFKITCSSHPPVADAGSNQIVEQHGATGSLVTLDGSGSSDPDGDPLIYTWTGPFGTATGKFPKVTIPAGTHTVTLVVNDGSFSSAPDTVQITVQDTTPPAIDLNQLVNTIWPVNKRMVDAAMVTNVADAVDDNPNVSYVVSSNQSISNGDWNVAGNTVSVKADRSGNDGDRVYSITATATDSSGNSSSQAVEVTVPHDQGKGKKK